MSDIVPFPTPNRPEESLEELVLRTHKLSQDSGNIFWDNPHVQIRLLA